MRSKTRYALLVDAYNVINAWNELKTKASYSLEDARESLIQIMSEYKSFSGQEIWLVFDAHNEKSSNEKIEERLGINIVYTKEHQTADSYLEKKAKELVGERNIEVRVATSDYAIQQNILGSGGSRISSRELKLEVNEQRKSIKDTTRNMKLSKNELAENLDEKTRMKMKKLMKTLENE